MKRPSPSSSALVSEGGGLSARLKTGADVELSAGGHTAEMMRLVAHLDWKRFSRRVWIISSGDALSETKALAFEKSIGAGEVSVAYTGSQSRSTSALIVFSHGVAVPALANPSRAKGPPILLDFTVHDPVLARLLPVAHCDRSHHDDVWPEGVCRPRAAERSGELRAHHDRGLPPTST